MGKYNALDNRTHKTTASINSELIYARTLPELSQKHKKSLKIKVLILILALLLTSFVILYFTYTYVAEQRAKMRFPVIVNTWGFTNATDKAWDVLHLEGKSALDAVEAGCTQCEIDQCDRTVGFGGSPDENGETTLDALIMDGRTHNVGAVASLRRIKNAIGVARKVLENTKHTLLVGDLATNFAKSMGFTEESLSTNESQNMWSQWKAGKCQPNFWTNVIPDPKVTCGPYRSNSSSSTDNDRKQFTIGSNNHDTIGMLVMDKDENMAVGTSSNGAKFKIPGRVGDSPIPGAGAYVDEDVGAAAATGDGDIMMRLLPSYQIVENMRNRMSPSDAARDAMSRIVRKFPEFSGGLIAVNKLGEFGASCHGMDSFPFSVRNAEFGKTTVLRVDCI